MAIKPKSIIDSAVGIGRAATSAATGVAGRLRGGRRDPATTTPPSAPATPDASTPATAKTGRATPAATKTARTKATGAKTAPKPAKKQPAPRSRAGASKRTNASRAAATSGKEVADAASGDDS